MVPFSFGILVTAIIVDHSRYLYQQFESGDIPEVYNRTIYQMEASPIMQQWPTAIEILQQYSRAGAWQKARNSLINIISNAPTIQNGQELLVSEFIRRNMLDFWWLTFPR
jgi:hypothetical protein